MQKINILFVITKLELGGAQRQLISLIRRLDRKKFNPFLFTAEEGFLMPEVQEIKDLVLKKSKHLERPINPCKDIPALFEIVRFIKSNHIDIVHTHSSKAGMLGRIAAGLSGVRIIIHTVHGWSFNKYQPALLRKTFIFLERFCAKLSSRIVIVSESDRRTGVNNLIGKGGDYVLINYGIDQEAMRQAAAARREIPGLNGVSPDDLLVAEISCFKPQKAPEDFVKLAALVLKKRRGVKFLLIGDGPLRGKIEELVKQSGIENDFILTGWRRDIPEILSHCQVLVLTSLWEGMPVAALEALASGVAVLATNTGGISEIIRDGENGFLAECKDLKVMQERLELLLRDKPLRERLKENARLCLGDKFSEEKMAANYDLLYLTLLREKFSRN